MATDATFPVRPDLRSFSHAGATVTLVDAERLLPAADGERVELLGGVAFPPPVRAVTLTVTRDGSDAFLDARILTGDAPAPRAGLTVLGNDPIGVFLSKRVESGDPWATRLVDGVGSVLANVSGRAEPPAADVSDDTVTLRTEVTAGELSVAHLEDFCRRVLDAIAEVTGPDALVGQVVTVSATSGNPDRVTLDQVGGLDDIVQQLREIAASFRHPQALARWGAKRPQGALFYGPPGTGKTMLARALANEIGARFREIRTTEILDKWLGASERNIKQIFRDARRYTEPTVLLFDEFDTIIGYASEGGDAASQAINSVAGIFKQEMNTLVDANPNVFVVATTNFPDRIDPSLVRSGRFDIKLAVPAPDATGRAQILAKMIRQLIVEHEVPGFRMFADDVDIVECATLSQGLTGADLKEVLRRAQLSKAMREARTGTPATAISQTDLLSQIEAVRAAGTRR